MWHSWTDGLVSTYNLVFFFFFLLYISFVSIVNDLTQHWCAWDDAACMCMGTSRTDWHVPMCTGVELSYLPFSIHLTVLLCLYTYICTPFPFVYFIAFLILFIHSIIIVMSTPVTTPCLYSLSVLYSHWWKCCIVTETSKLLWNVG